TGIDVAVGGKYVLPTIVVVVEKSRAPAKKRNRGGSDAGLKADVGKISITLVAIKGIVIVGERRHVEREVSAIFVIADSEPHRRLFPAVFFQRKSGWIAGVFESSIALVQKQIIRHGIIGHGKVESSIIVKIRESHAEPVIALFIGDASFFAHLGECAVPVVVKKVVLLSSEPSRPAHHWLSSILTKVILRRGRSGDGRIIQVEFHVAGHIKIQVAVAVIIAERSTRRPD